MGDVRGESQVLPDPGAAADHRDLVYLAGAVPDAEASEAVSTRI